MFYSQGCPLLLFPNAKLQFFQKISKKKIKKTSLQLHSNYHTKTDKNILTKAFPKSLSSSSYAPPLCLVTKLDDNTIIIPLSIRVSSSLVRRIIRGTRETLLTFLFGKGTRSYGTMIVDRIYSFCSPRLELDVMI